jgi:hypothetical protein
MTTRTPALKISIDGSETPLPASKNEMLVYASISGLDSKFDERFINTFGLIPSNKNPGEEGFGLAISNTDGWVAHLCGVDERGLLYGLGRLLYTSKKAGPLPEWAEFVTLSAPRIERRAMNGSFKYTMDPKGAKKTNARAWILPEAYNYFEAHLFLGINTYQWGRGRVPPVGIRRYRDSGGTEGVSKDGDRLSDSYGVDIYAAMAVNGLGSNNLEENWNATSKSGRKDKHLACMSNPDAREAVLECYEVMAEKMEHLDMVSLHSADIAGCHCSECHSDWAKTFYDFCVEAANRMKKHKPNLKILFTNQEFSFEDNERLFTLLRNDEDSPLDGFAYSPSGSENSTYGDKLKNPKWNRFPGVYPAATFLKSRLRYLRPNQELLARSDITHWKRAADAIPQVDPVISEIYPRRTYNARPRAYEKVFRELMAYGDGFSGYSEGHFDDFNKFLFLRLMWNPDLTAHEIALEYFTYNCGEKVAPLLAEAVFLGEEIREQPFMQCGEKIARYRELITQAEAKMPAEYLRDNWRFAMMMVRSMIDSLVYERTLAFEAQMETAKTELRAAVKNKTLREQIPAIREKLGIAPENNYLERARAADEVSNKAHALREPGLLVLDEKDAVGIFWLRKVLLDAMELNNDDELEQTIEAALNYDVVGDGEFYDNCGTLDGQPHYDITTGNLYYGTGGWPMSTRPSARWYNYSFEVQDGLEFNYIGLGQQADYEITVTYPAPTGVSFALNTTGKNSFDILADGVNVGTVEPGDSVEQFTFDLPKSETRDGVLNISLRKTESSRCTVISEIWIRKKK